MYDSCNYYTFNYSTYNTDDFLHWDREAMLANFNDSAKCEKWVYDQSVMENSMISKVHMFINQHSKLSFYLKYSDINNVKLIAE